MSRRPAPRPDGVVLVLALLAALALGQGCDGDDDDDTTVGTDDDDAADDDSATGNAAPAIDPVDDPELVEGESLELTITATDPDGDPVTFVFLDLPSFATGQDEGGDHATLQLAPAHGDAGSYDVTVEASDGDLTAPMPLTITVNAAPQVITFAGSPGGAGIGDGVGTDAFFYHPYGSVWHGDKLYIADGWGQSIRVFDLDTGEVSTLAGVPGESGLVDSDEGPARFAYPCGMDVGPDGLLYVADRENGRVRSVDPDTGEVNTVEDTQGEFLAAEPFDVTFDDQGSMYVTDLEACVIRRLSPAGHASVFAGEEGNCHIIDGPTETARVGKPRGIHFDPHGYLWYADRHGHDIRRIEVATGTISTPYGSESGVTGFVDGVGVEARFAYPTGVFVDADTLYVADSDNDSVRRIGLIDNTVTTIAGIGVNGNADGPGAEASFSWPIDVTVGPDGALWVVDPGGHALRRIALDDPDLLVTTEAGALDNSGTADGIGTDARMSEPRGLARSDGDTLWLLDSLNSKVRTVDLQTAEVVTVAGSAEDYDHLDGVGLDARFTNPSAGVWVDDRLFVVEPGSHTIRTIDGLTAEVVTVAGEPFESGYLDGTGTEARFARPRDIVLAEDGMLYILDNTNHAIRRMDPDTFEVTTLLESDAAANPLTDPEGLAADGDGTLYVTDFTDCILVAVSLEDGTVEVVAGDREECAEVDGVGLLGKLDGPIGIDIDPFTGVLYIADITGRTVRQFDPMTGLLFTLTGDPGVMQPADGPLSEATYSTPTDVLVVDDHLYVLDRYSAHIRRLELP
jgi:sugar lactone lactonase YvrE